MIAPSDSIEASFFYRIATIQPGDAHAAWLNGRARPLDWDRLIGLALLENAITVLNECVVAMPAAMVPSEARDRIGRLALVWIFKLKMLEKRLADSLRILSDAGIEVTLLKGAALAHTVYRSFADRPMADIDLLVDPAHARKAHDLMQQAGWSLDNGMYPADAWDEHHHLPPLTDTSGSGLRLEIHTAPLSPGHPFRLDLNDVLEASSEVEVAGIRVRVLEPHLHAVHAAIHFAWSHRFESGGLNIFRDLGALHRSGNFSWPKFVEAAHRTQSETSCYWTIRLAHSLTGLPVPSKVLKEISPALGESTLAVLEEHLSQLIFNAEYACPSATLRHRLWALALQTKGVEPGDARNWDTHAPKTPSPSAGRALRRVASHIRRVPRWSRYVASLLAPAFGLIR